MVVTPGISSAGGISLWREKILIKIITGSKKFFILFNLMISIFHEHPAKAIEVS